MCQPCINPIATTSPAPAATAWPAMRLPCVTLTANCHRCFRHWKSGGTPLSYSAPTTEQPMARMVTPATAWGMKRYGPFRTRILYGRTGASDDGRSQRFAPLPGSNRPLSKLPLFLPAQSRIPCLRAQAGFEDPVGAGKKTCAVFVHAHSLLPHEVFLLQSVYRIASQGGSGPPVPGQSAAGGVGRAAHAGRLQLCRLRRWRGHG